MNKNIAFCYDFDGTLCPKNMQEYGYLKALGIEPKKFWEKSNFLGQDHAADSILAYMCLMLKEAKEKKIKITKDFLLKSGHPVSFFPGVTTWFDKINDLARHHGVKVEHYVISSGIKEIIEGCKIAPHFNHIYASSYMYDEKGIAFWPATAINYTTKTQFLFRINKGAYDVRDSYGVNAFIKKEDRAIPFEHMMFIGDGETDIPCMSLVKQQGGVSCAVYKNKAISVANAKLLLKEKRVNIAAPADFRTDSEIFKAAKKLIEKVALNG